jgi:hypothetical protein
MMVDAWVGALWGLGVGQVGLVEGHCIFFQTSLDTNKVITVIFLVRYLEISLFWPLEKHDRCFTIRLGVEDTKLSNPNPQVT